MSTMQRQPGQTFVTSRAGHSSVFSQPNQTSIMNHITTGRGYNDQSKFIQPGQSTFMQTRQQEEVQLLKHVITKLCDKLREYQSEFGSKKNFLAKEQQEVDDIINLIKVREAGADKAGIDAIEEHEEGFEKLLGGHIIGPLISEYENHLKAQSREISILKTALRQQNDAQRELMTDNETLVKNLAVKQREYLKLIEETRENVGLLENVNESNSESPEKSGEGSQNMRERVHLLTEENHILFE